MLDKTTANQAKIEDFKADIDYRYYDERARNLRSEAAWGWLKGMNTEKNYSSVKQRSNFFDQLESLLDSFRCKLRPCTQV